MKKIKKVYKSINEYLYEHRKVKFVLEVITTVIASFISAFCFAYGFRSFIAPTGNENIQHLVSGGISGLSQVLIRACEIIFHNSKPFGQEMMNNMQSILYFVINVPLFILAFFKIGKKFALYSILNVVFVSLLISAIPESWTSIFDLNEDFIARAIFAGLLTGISSSIAVKFGHSAGGIDIVSIYVSSKTKTTMGKYILGFNSIIIISFTLLKGPQEYAKLALYSIAYLFTSSRVIDALCIRNKKVQLQIITEVQDMEKILITNLPHSCTVVDAKGAYKNTKRKIIYMNVSASELKASIKMVREIDANAFVSVLDLHNLYGRFYIKPLE